MLGQFFSHEQSLGHTTAEEEYFTKVIQSLNRIESIVTNSALTQAQLQMELLEAEKLFNGHGNQLTDVGRQETVASRLFDLKHQVAKRGIGEALTAINDHISSSVIKKDYINYWLNLAQQRIKEADEFLDVEDRQNYQKQLTEVVETINTL